MEGAVFKDAELSRAIFIRANLSDVDLSGAVLKRANLEWAVLNKANIANADFFEATLNSMSADGMKGTYKARNLLSTIVNSELLYFPHIE